MINVIHGTLKSIVYAMLFALPLALFAAVYVSQFTTPAFKQVIKPVIEVMAAIPSVVVGFLLLLWLAPLMGQWIVAVLTSLVTIPAALVVFMVLWQFVRRYDWAKRVENGCEFLALVPVMALGAVTAVVVAPHVEAVLFQGSFQQWLFERTQSPYDPLNSLVVSFGLVLQ